MSQIVLDIPQRVYSALVDMAQATGTTPESWIENRLGALLENDNEERAQGLAYYLGAISTAGEITPATANHALKIWNDLRRRLPSLPVPDAASGPEGQLLYTWDNAEHHLELELFANGSVEAFYRNRLTGELWEQDYSADHMVPDEVVARFNLIYLTHE